MPEQTASPQGVNVDRAEGKPKPKKFPLVRFLKWLFVVFIIVFLAAGSLLVAASYLSVRVPLVSVDLQRKVDYLVASIPIFPKTPKQILTKAFEDSQKINTAKQNFELTVQSGDQSLGSLSVESQINAEDLDNISLDARIRGEGILGEQGSKTDLSIVEIGSDLYFKFDQAPSISSLTQITGRKVTYDLSALQGKWFKLNIKQAETSLGAQVRENKEIKGDINKKLEEIFTCLEENDIFKKIKKLPSEKLLGGESYHLQLLVDSATLTKIFQKITPEAKVQEEEVAETVKEFNLDLWVDQKSFFINKLATSLELTNLESSSTSPSISQQKLQIKASYELSEINKETKINQPKGTTELQSILDLLFLVQPSSAALSPFEGILGVSSSSAEFGSNVLFLERAIHVVTLFPSSL